MKTELQKQKDREYSKKYYEAHKAEISARRKERQKQDKYKEYKHNYYMAHREEIKAKQKARYAAKKAVKDALNVWPLPITGISHNPKVQDVYVLNSWAKQLTRIEKVFWWICFAISFVGVAILFK